MGDQGTGPAVEKGALGVKPVRGPYVRLPPHADAVETVDELERLVEKLRPPDSAGPALAADLFCGAGGLSLGLSDAGYAVVLGIDHDDDALATHRAYHPGLSVNWDLGAEDVMERTGELIKGLGIDLVAGGPPCQPFSKAGRSGLRDLVRTGRRAAHDERSDLWQSFLRVVKVGEPKAVLMENVPDMALDDNMLILREMANALESLDYSVETRVLDSWRYGVPQHRQRLILVALSERASFEWPAEDEHVVTLGNAILDLPPIEGGWRPEGGADGWAQYDGPKSSFQALMRKGVVSDDEAKLFDHITRPVREDDRKIFESMDAKTKYSEIDPALRRYRDDIFDDKYKRLDFDGLSRTITAHIAKDGYWYIHPEQHRTISVREAARIQTFPDHIRFAGPPTAAFRQIGNAVPPRLAASIGKSIQRSLERNKRVRYGRRDVAERLAGWFDTSPHYEVPWLTASSRWVVLQSELLLPRLSFNQIARGYELISSFSTPKQTLESEPLLRVLANLFGIHERVDILMETAAFFAEIPAGLSDKDPLEQMTFAPNVSKSLAMFVARVVPGPDADPVIANPAVLRVAARFKGTSVHLHNKLSDGRLAIAELIGCDEDEDDDCSHRAHLALIEIGQTICGPRKTDCIRCPLEDDCAVAADQPIQQSLMELTNPER